MPHLVIPHRAGVEVVEFIQPSYLPLTRQLSKQIPELLTEDYLRPTLRPENLPGTGAIELRPTSLAVRQAVHHISLLNITVSETVAQIKLPIP